MLKLKKKGYARIDAIKKIGYFSPTLSEGAAVLSDETMVSDTVLSEEDEVSAVEAAVLSEGAAVLSDDAAALSEGAAVLSERAAVLSVGTGVGVLHVRACMHVVFPGFAMHPVR